MQVVTTQKLISQASSSSVEHILLMLNALGHNLKVSHRHHVNKC